MFLKQSRFLLVDLELNLTFISSEQSPPCICKNLMLILLKLEQTLDGNKESHTLSILAVTKLNQEIFWQLLVLMESIKSFNMEQGLTLGIVPLYFKLME
mgnify:FL=1